MKTLTILLMLLSVSAKATENEFEVNHWWLVAGTSGKCIPAEVETDPSYIIAAYGCYLKADSKMAGPMLHVICAKQPFVGNFIFLPSLELCSKVAKGIKK